MMMLLRSWQQRLAVGKSGKDFGEFVAAAPTIMRGRRPVVNSPQASKENHRFLHPARAIATIFVGRSF
ncbi:MAG: hypothetical protein AB7O59_09135 [Pirellulales bacterium]